MILKVNPTRMELLKLKKRLKTAQKGHKLLKEKRDGLMKEFMEIIKQAKKARLEMEQKLQKGFYSFTLASANMTPFSIETSSLMPSQKINASFSVKNVMSVKIPIINVETSGNYLCYGYFDTSSELDIAIENLGLALPEMVKLAQIEKGAQMLSVEIEKTRRRVNALEHVLIPNIIDTIKYISMKLSEQERSTIASTMRIKKMIQK